MYRFVGWRFGKLKKRFGFYAAVVTHSDQGHYKGLQKFWDQELLSFDRLYHNGIAERDDGDVLGRSDASGRFLTGIMATDADIRALYADQAVRGAKKYPKLSTPR